MNGKLAIAILAAGGATRFGGGKLDAPLAGKPLGRHALDAVLGLDGPKPVIVVGNAPPDFAADAETAGLAELLVNPDAAQGLGTSVARAAQHACSAGAGKLLLLLADMPQVATATLAKLVDAAAPERPAAVRYPGHPGIPACFPADYFAKLETLAGERGAAALLRDAPGVILIEAAADELADVDTKADFDELTARHRL